MKKKLIILSGSILGSMPLLASAQTTGQVSCRGVGLGSIEGIVCKIGDILNIVIPILIVLGVVLFIWGVVMYVISSDEEAKKKGRDRMIYGIIGLVVIIAIWGLVGVVRNSFGLNSGPASPATPYVPF